MACPRARRLRHRSHPARARVAELADALDSKSGWVIPVWVRVPPLAPFTARTYEDRREPDRGGGPGPYPPAPLPPPGPPTPAAPPRGGVDLAPPRRTASPVAGIAQLPTQSPERSPERCRQPPGRWTRPRVEAWDQNPSYSAHRPSHKGCTFLIESRLCGQEPVTQLAVEGLDTAVFPGTSRPDEQGADPDRVQPVPNCLRRALRAVVGRKCLRRPSTSDNRRLDSFPSNSPHRAIRGGGHGGGSGAGFEVEPVFPGAEPPSARDRGRVSR